MNASKIVIPFKLIQLDSLLKEARDFFALPQPTKKKYSRHENKNAGWVCVERER